MKKLTTIIFLLIILLPITEILSQQLAFPGAQGWGKYTTGGRGGAVIEVTNLNDGGAGSFRAALATQGARIVVFRVSGTIELKSEIRITSGNLTIAGQTAPGDGICIKNYSCILDADNIIIRYIRFRPGDLSESDACFGRQQKNIIIDHCSFSWAVDEVASFYGNENFTLQYCIISESLYNSIHTKGAHGYGGIWGGNKASFHHNLLAHHTSRNPRFNGARFFPGIPELVDFRNNVIYNWGFNSSYAGEPNETDGTKANINIVDNYFKSGPATNSGNIKYRIISPSADPKFGYSYFFINGNYIDGYPDVTADNWTKGVQEITQTVKDTIRKDKAFSYDSLMNQTAQEAYQLVLNEAGACLPRRDTVDSRIAYEVKNKMAFFGGTYKGPNTGIIDKPADVGGWPELFSAPASVDTDKDGMPDFWELEKGLDPNNAADRNNDYLGEGFTNIEYYINSIDRFANFVKPVSGLKIKLSDITSISLEWTDNSDNENSFLIERSVGSGFVAIGQLPANTQSFTDKNLTENTTYSYRLRACNSTDTSVYSAEISIKTYSSTAQPLLPTNPQPFINESNVRKHHILSWEKGLATDNFDLYFGTSNPPPFITTLNETFYDPGVLSENTVYYWRVDANNKNGFTLGDEWRFSTRQILDNKLVGHWTLDYYNLAYDSSEFANNGKVVDPKVLSLIYEGVKNKALTFNGNSQYVEIPHNYIFDFEENAFSVSFWLLQSTNQKGDQTFILKGSETKDSINQRSGKHYEIYSKNNTICFSLADGTNISIVESSDSGFITGQWVHVAAVREYNSRKIKLYANGLLRAEANDLTEDISQDENLFFAYNPEKNLFLNATLDDIRFYNYALTHQEIATIAGVRLNAAFLKENQLLVYPNPVKDKLIIEGLDNLIGTYQIEIFDISGKKLRSLPINNIQENKRISIAVNELQNGFYYLNVKEITGVKSIKFFVLK